MNPIHPMKSNDVQNVREAISRRAIDELGVIAEEVEKGVIGFDAAYRFICSIHNIIYPFVTYDMKQTLDVVSDGWRQLANEKKKRDEAREAREMIQIERKYGSTSKAEEISF